MTDQRNYDGPAVLVSGTDEIPVNAELRIESEPYGDGALHSWCGDLTSDDPRLDPRLVQVIGRKSELRVDGGMAIVYVHSVQRDQATGVTVADIMGEGRAPWLGDEQP